nr:hypothetical protein [Paenibacillus polymyxa]
MKDKGQPEIAEIAPYIHDCDLVDGKPAVYVRAFCLSGTYHLYRRS